MVKINPTKKRLPISSRIILLILLFCVSTFIFGILAHEVVRENEDWFDTKAFNFLKQYSTAAIISFFRVITFLGSGEFLVPAYIVTIVILVKKGRPNDATDVGLIAVISSLLMWGLKSFYARSRPEMPLFKGLSSYSFPSGHATSTFVFACVLTWLVSSSHLSKSSKIIITIGLFLFSVLIGISRIVLRYHYASDVLAGFCLGCSFMLLFLFIQNKLRTKRVF